MRELHIERESEYGVSDCGRAVPGMRAIQPRVAPIFSE